MFVLCHELITKNMIYLFGTGSYKDNRKAFKIGYTDKKEDRTGAYKLHNPLGEFLGWRDGDKILEEKLHLRLKDYKEEFLDEWFYSEEDVEKIFNETEEEIDRWLWDNRGDIFFASQLPAPGTIKRQILDQLAKNNKEK